MDNTADKNWDRRHNLSVVLAIVLILAVVGGSAILLANARAFQVQSLLNDDDYETAVLLYNETIAEKPLQRFIGRLVLGDYVSSSAASLERDLATYDETVARLEAETQFDNAKLCSLARQELSEIVE